jgi:hypothetical protein
MKSSLVTADLEHCFVCGTTQNLQEHHCFHGTANRKQADKFRLTVPLCFDCHNELHNKNTELDRHIMQLAQIEFEKNFSFEEFMKIFKKNYR